MADEKCVNQWNPGMRSDSEPQPKYDPDIVPDPGSDPNDDRSEIREADQIRKEWIDKEQEEHPEKQIKDPARNRAT
ncbi:MAG: hypothetical protein H0X25_06800 [Acidobacteriales bacterium]|nr:hypothetical protein [Terriglobales bacterium]